MKKAISGIIILVFILFATDSLCQKQDNVWLMGYDYYPNLRSGLDFYWGYPDTTAFNSPFELDKTDASICDNDGNLLFYTNGIYVSDKNHGIMQGSLNFNADSIVTYYGLEYLPFSQSALILPFPNHPNQYYLFHLSGRMFNGFNDVQPFWLAYSVVDITGNNATGKMTINKEVVVEDTLLYGTLQAVQHGNGRDWWIIVGAYNDSHCYRLLLTPEGIVQVSNPSWGAYFHSGFEGQSAFSPDGQQFAIAYPDSNKVYLWDFNRCSGELLLKTVFSPEKTGEFDDAYGCSFSPNSRYLYISSYLTLHQYDTWSNNIEATDQIVAEWDGYIDFIYPVSFARQQLGPDGRIYISSLAPAQSLNVIAQPNIGGTACSVLQHTPALSYYTYNNGNTLPNFPHYRTGTLGGSACDSLGFPVSSTEIDAKKNITFNISPNPADNFVTIFFKNAAAEQAHRLTIISLDGQLIFDTQVSSNSPYCLDTHSWTSGIYLVRVYSNDSISNEKLVIQKS